MKRHLFIILLIFTFFIACGLFVLNVRQGNKEQFSGPTRIETLPKDGSSSAQVQGIEGERGIVTKVVDGDTIEVQIGEGVSKLRYIGIDTPETVDPRRPVGCFGKQASDQNKSLVLGKEVILQKDVSETDKFGRLLRYVYVGDIFVNDYLVRNGFARASTYPPDVLYSQQFLEAEREARDNKRGLWGSC